jgi:serine/threonine protein kinase
VPYRSQDASRPGALEPPPEQLTAPRAGEFVDHPAFVGPYRVLGLLAEGGMGTVYIAEQQEPVRRRVAVKVIKLGMDTREVVARFEAERQALAVMEHPGIAKVLDGGVTADGRP